MSRRQGAPPRWARALLDLCLLRDDAGSITGDLDEEYARFVRPTKGRWRADAWYWRQTLMTIPRLLARRLPRSEGGGALAADTILALKLLRRRPRYVVATVGTLALALGDIARAPVGEASRSNPDAGVQSTDSLSRRRNTLESVAEHGEEGVPEVVG